VSNALSKPVSFSRPKVGYFSNRPRMSRIIREETETVDRGWCSGNQYGSFCRSVACPHCTGGLVTSKCNTLNCGNFMSRQHAHESTMHFLHEQNKRDCVGLFHGHNYCKIFVQRTTTKFVTKKVMFVRTDPM